MNFIRILFLVATLMLPLGVLFGATVNATFNSASDIPVTSASYTTGGNEIALSLNYAPTTGTNLTIIRNTGLPFINGQFANLSHGESVYLTYAGKTYRFIANYYGGSGNDLVLEWAFRKAVGWGDNRAGQLGIMTKDPVQVTTNGILFDKTVVAVSTNSTHSLALCSDGTIAAWGDNTGGQLGNNSLATSGVPVTVINSGVLFGKTVVAVSAGGSHSLALCSDGTIAAWGSGLLGNNSTTQSNVPVLVNQSGVLSGKTVVAISAGEAHSLALCSDGTIAAWGDNNSDGQLGNNSNTDSSVPVLVTMTGALSGKTVVAISASYRHNIALCSDGTMATWGLNNYGQLGNNTLGGSSKVPVLVNQSGVLAGKTVVAISAGEAHSLALCSDGTIAAWGANNFGQLGNNSNTDSSVPVLVTMTGALSGKTVVAISASYRHNIALCSDGTMATWGLNNYGQLGNNSLGGSSKVPVLVNQSGVLAGKTVVAISAGEAHSLALCSDGTIAAWGANNFGQLGNNSTAQSNVPVLVTRSGVLSGKTVVDVSTSSNHSLALCSDGTIAAWGDNTLGQLGNNSLATSGVPVRVINSGVLFGKTVLKVSAGGSHSLALCSDGTIAAWGNNFSGQLGNNSTTQSNVPVLVNQSGVLSGKTVVAVSAGSSHSLALCSDGTIAAWGYNWSGQLGNNSMTQSNVPVLVNQSGVLSGKTVVAVSTNSTHSLALCSDGTIAAWGDNTLGQLGNNSTTQSNVPVLVNQSGVLSGKTVVSVSAGNFHSLALCSDGTIAAWGYNFSGQLGNNSATQSNVPVLVSRSGVLSTKTVMALSTGQSQSLALCSDGTIAAWGDNNSYGQLGNIISTDSRVPELVNQSELLAGKTLLSLSSGSTHSLALFSDGTIAAWGYYEYSQSKSSAQLSQNGVLSGKTVVAVSAGSTHSLALCSDGAIAAWGYNFSGQLGNNSTTNSNVPVLVNQSGVLSGKTVVAVSAGQSHSLALCSDGTIAAWGRNSSGQLGNNSIVQSSVPVLVSRSGVLSGKTVVAVSAGSTHSLALCSDGAIAAWGYNFSGQLGNNSTTNSNVPVLVNQSGVLSGKTVVAVSAGQSHSLALCSDGTIAAWGDNTLGQLGNNSIVQSSVPVLVSRSGVLSGKTVVAVSAGSTHSLALCSDGAIAAWGYNYFGQLGNNSSSEKSVPVLVNQSGVLSGKAVVGLSAGNSFSLAVANYDHMIADLENLSLSSGIINPQFDSATTDYSVDVSDAASSITVFPTAVASEFSVIKVNGNLVSSGTSSPSIPLAFGPNLIEILVTAPDAITTKTYKIVISRKQSSVSTLSSLNLSMGTLSPSFSSSTLNYTTSVANATTSITLTPSTTNSFATVRVNGTQVTSGSASASIPLSVGNNTITVIGISQDGTTTTTYTVNVNRRSAVSTLSSLTASEGTVIDRSGNTTFISLSQAVSGIRLTPTLTDPKASVRVNGSLVTSGSASALIPINALTPTQISVVVTAEDQLYTTTYTINVVRMLTSSTASVVSANQYQASGIAAELELGFVPATGESILLVNQRGLGFISGEFSNLRHGQELSMSLNGREYRFVVDYFGGDGNDLVLQWADNAIVAWGENSEGQLGIGSLANQSVPTDLVASGVLSGKKVKAVAAGAFHTLALSDEGVLTSWGLNSSGQLGTKNTANTRLPVAVSRPAFLEGKQIVGIAAGENFSMALCSDGTLATWGDNTYKQLGDGSSKVNSIEPVNITGMGALSGRTVTAICAGARHAMALCTDGRVVSWGFNENGQLGNGNTQNQNLPVLVTPPTGLWTGKTVRAISAGGKHSMVLFTDGVMSAWGANQAGQLGNNSTTASNVPILIPIQGAISGKTVIGVAAGSDHSLALCSDGTVAAWGLNLSGQLGNSSNNTSFVPIPVTMNTGALLNKRVTAIAAALDHSVALCSDETMVSWGANVFGSLGNNSNTSSNIPVAVTRSGVLSSKKVATVACAGAQSFALCSDGTLTSWGLNTFGQLGNNTTESSRVPVAVTTTTGALFGKTILSTSVGKAHTVVRFSNGTMAAWGRNAEGQLGNNTTTNSNIPVEVFHSGVLFGKKIADVSAGANHTIALCSDGTVVTWGSNIYGQLGNGSAIVSSVIPVNVTGLGALSGRTVVAVKAGANHCAVLCSDGRVVTWGRGNFGQLGAGTTTNSSLPVAVTWTGVMVGKSVSSIATGADHTLALCSDGTLVAWGRNDFGQIGNNLIGNPIVPSRVETTSGALIGKTVTQIAAGMDHSLALLSDGTVASWGSNAKGQLGSTGSNGSFVPIAVTRNIGALFGKTVIKISCGEHHSMALSSDGSLASWGQGTSGQLGNNTLISSDLPESVTSSGAVSGKSIWSLGSGGGSSFALAAVPAPLEDAALYDLSVLGSNLSTVFDPDIDSYQTSVKYGVNSATIKAVALNPAAKIKINGVLEGTDTVTKTIPLVVGTNTIKIEVILDANSTTALYTLTIVRESPSNLSTLTGLEISSGTLSPTFSSTSLNYTATVTSVTSAITVTPTSASDYATVRVNGTTVASGTASQSIPLNVGNNTIVVRITAQDGTTISTYTIVVMRVSSDSTLSTLALSGGLLSPSFSANTLSYTARVNNTVSSISVIPTAANGFATLRVNGSVVASGTASQSIPLSVGKNTITVTGTSQDGTSTSTYTVVVTRLLSDVSTLSSLVLSSGTLSPGFASNTLNYTTSVPMQNSSISVLPILSSSLATVKINGTSVTSGTASENIPLNFGINTISIVVLAQDGTTTSTYTLTVMKHRLSLVNEGNAIGGTFAMNWNANDVATLVATPQPGYLFSSWTGDASGSSNPSTLLMNSDKTVGATFVEDARDSDGDGITNYQEIVLNLTNPNVPDSDGNGLSDTLEFIFDMGDLPVFSPRVGDRLRFNVGLLGHTGVVRLSGRLPAGLTFNAVTGIIEGKLTAAARTSTVTIQYLNGRTVIRSVPLTMPVSPFPAALTGTWQALIYDNEGVPQGMLTTTLSSPGAWTASLDLAGATSLRSARGTFDLKPAEENLILPIRFPATRTLPQLDMQLNINGAEAIFSGQSNLGEIYGFRLARGSELPASTVTYTMVLDHGYSDGYAYPGGLGWATGTISPNGNISMTGQLGDSQTMRATIRLGATGQAMVWLKPYRNKSSFMGGYVSFYPSGIVPGSNFSDGESRLVWKRNADANELSYPQGFLLNEVDAMVNAHTAPATAAQLGQQLGLPQQTFSSVEWSGAGVELLSNSSALPNVFVMDSTYKLIAQPIPGRVVAPWTGSINRRSGAFSGNLTNPSPTSDLRSGRFPVNGVIFPFAEGDRASGAGLIKIPITTRTGAFRTGRVVLRP